MVARIISLVGTIGKVRPRLKRYRLATAQFGGASISGFAAPAFGKKRGKRGRGADGKSKVVGVVQRSGKVVAKPVPDVKRSTLVLFIANKVSRDGRCCI